MADLPAAIAALRATALGYPEAVEEHPWGQSAFKVRSKTFVFMTEFPAALNCGFKLPQTFEFALDRSFTRPAGYGLARARWVDCHFEADDDVPLDVIRAWIDESYRAIAPKRLVKGLPGG